MSLLGHLNFASMVIPQVQSFVAYLLSLATSVKQLHHYVTLNKEGLLDIAMWCRFLTEWNGVALFLDQEYNEHLSTGFLELYPIVVSAIPWG